jgi:hypothetical protein
MSAADEQTPILRSALTLQRSTLWLGTMALYEDRLSITGWSWTGRVDRTLSLDDVRLVEMWPVPRGVNLAIYPTDGGPLFCRVAEDLLRWVNEFRKDDRTSLDVQPDHYPSFSAGMSTRPLPVETVPHVRRPEPGLFA